MKSFLLGHSQPVQVNGEKSGWADVISGVPQGTVLGPFLFITCINGIVCNLNSKIKLFADDAVMHREIQSSQDEVIFQNDIDSITDWAKTWQMSLNFDKCNVMSITTISIKIVETLLSFRVDFKLGAKMAPSPAPPGQCCVFLFSTSLVDSGTTLIRVGEGGVSRKRTFWTSFLCKQ